ncbi:MAG: PPA1309 family protein [Nocardioidaceae bacterium]|nr:PPA1309 family protein [Nocardioidaceae bacterium]
MDYELDVDPALAAAVLEVEGHHARIGWDQPAGLYALVNTATLVVQEPELAAQLGLDTPAEQGSLTPIEQETLPPEQELEQVLPGIVWPEQVIGCVAVVERLVLPPAADGHVPQDPTAAREFAREHPAAEEVRIVAGVTRHGASYCALRLRSHDEDNAVMGGADLVPALLELLHETLRSETPAEGDDEPMSDKGENR